MGSAGSSQLNYFDNTESPQCYDPSWMSSLPDDRFLSEMSIPGTHETMSFYGGNMVICQTWSLTKQLEAGCRFLDVRFRHYGNALPLHHGCVFQHGYLTRDVIEPTAEFLRSHRTETVIMNIQDEHYKPIHGDLTVEQLVRNSLNNGASGMWLPDVPQTLGEARGKILVVRNRWEGSFGKPLDSFDSVANEW